jgi:predicted RNA-binding protein with PIN domain
MFSIPMPYWLDGNNLIGQSAATSRRDPATRKLFLGLVSQYARTRGGRFLVYFDGDDPGHAMPPRGVRVRYSAPLSTDDAILHDVKGARTAREIIVVTNDQRLASCCRSVGARTLNWREFTGKMGTAGGTPRNIKPGAERVDLKQWADYFGFDPEQLE